MTQLLPDGYERIDERWLGERKAVAWLSREDEDISWDSFLQQTPYGHYQQSTMWARAKAVEGWAPLRVVITLDGEMAGGFQILRRSAWWGGIGYVSKGPVIAADRLDLAEYAKELLLQATRNDRLNAIVVQAPDLCVEMAAQFRAPEFMPHVLTRVNDSTWIISLREGLKSINHKMSRTTRQQVRQAQNRGIVVRVGDREDLPLFFTFMRSTCLRQGVVPNPADVQFLYQLWDAAQPTGNIRLFIAEHEGSALSGLLCILFGRTVSAWKKGWTSTESHRHPNDLIMNEVLKWACQAGYEYIDFTAFDKSMALAMLRGQPITVSGQRSRHFFNVRFGGGPRLLPEAKLFIENVFLRFVYKVIFYAKNRDAGDGFRPATYSAQDYYRDK